MLTDREELDRLFSETYEELRRLAAQVRRGDPRPTLNPTALVNEAYVKLARSLRALPVSRLHFKRIAARAMRQVLIEAARRQSAEKRGGGYVRVTLDEATEATITCSEELLALDRALEDFARVQPRQALVVELHFFGGLTLDEAAESLQVSQSTIDRDWRAARAWLAREVRKVS